MIIGEAAHPVIFTGENPGLTLYQPGSDRIVAAASYWLCSSSPQGEGEALIIWADPEGSGLGDLAPRGIFADNLAMARRLNDDLNQHFGSFSGRGFADLEVQAARFSKQADGARQHRVVCWTATSTIEIVWSGAGELEQKMLTLSLGGRDFRLANVMTGCSGGSLSVNGTAASGEVRPDPGTGSSSFLAFAESWVAL